MPWLPHVRQVCTQHAKPGSALRSCSHASAPRQHHTQAASPVEQAVMRTSTKNFLVASTLLAFVSGVYTYTIRQMSTVRRKTRCRCCSALGLARRDRSSRMAGHVAAPSRKLLWLPRRMTWRRSSAKSTFSRRRSALQTQRQPSTPRPRRRPTCSRSRRLSRMARGAELGAGTCPARCLGSGGCQMRG